jgi:hypothetical protein
MIPQSTWKSKANKLPLLSPAAAGKAAAIEGA